MKKLLNCVVSSGFVSGFAYAKKKAKGPNIILIMADDMGYECVGANGGTSYKTPVLDKLATNGVRFEHCYSQSLCTPSRVKIMTGIYNVHNYVKFGHLDWDQTTFANILKKARYKTCIAGKWQLGGGNDAPGHFGFDEYCLWLLNDRTRRYRNPGLEINGKLVNYRNGEYGPDVVSDYICDFIERKSKKRRPFFVYYPMILPHGPYVPTPDSPNWNSGKIRDKTHKGLKYFKYFADMAAYTDKMVGKIIKKLEQLGLRQNTLILFTCDNGTDFKIASNFRNRLVYGGKGKMTDSGTHVPLIANWLGVVPPGRVLQDLVDFSDFLPTICECAGIEVPVNLGIDGRSFMPQLLGKTGNPREWVYCWDEQHPFARTQRYKLYEDGKFYDLNNDVNETTPLDMNDPDTEAANVYKMLLSVLEKHKNERLDRINKSKYGYD